MNKLMKKEEKDRIQKKKTSEFNQTKKKKCYDPKEKI